MNKKLLITLSALFCTGTALADPIGPNCTNNSCDGGIYTLSYSGTPEYVNTDGTKVGALVSENITLQDGSTTTTGGEVPEPATVVLLGLAGVLAHMRSREVEKGA